VSGDINVHDVAGGLTIADLTGFTGTNGVSITHGFAGDDICITATDSLTVDAAVINHGTGVRQILLAAGDVAGGEGRPGDDLVIRGNVAGGEGALGGDLGITLLAGDSILLATNVQVSAVGQGTLEAQAGTVFNTGQGLLAGSAGGDIRMYGDSLLETQDGSSCSRQYSSR
jgi:hypothetical protein